MRILIGMANLRSTGALTMGMGLMNGLRELPESGHDEYFVLHPENVGYEEFAPKPNWHMIPVSSRGGLLNYKFRLEQLTIPRIIRSNKIDVLLTFNSIGTWRPSCPHVAFVHLPHLAYRLKEMDFPKPFSYISYSLFYLLYFKAMLGRTSDIVVQTDVMKGRISKRWSFPLDRVHVVHPGVSDFGARSSDEQLRDLPDVLNNRASARPLLSYIAGPMSHKNFEILPRTLAVLRSRDFDCDLVVTVPRDHPEVRHVLKLAESLGVSDRLIFVGNVTRDQVAAIYRASWCMVMPSLLETFGLPYIETMQCGCPVVAADRDFARVTCADGALYFDPKDPESVASSIMQLRSDATRAQLLQAAQKQLTRHFSNRTWTDMAKDFREICDQTIKAQVAAKP